MLIVIALIGINLAATIATAKYFQNLSFSRFAMSEDNGHGTLIVHGENGSIISYSMKSDVDNGTSFLNAFDNCSNP